MIPDWALRGSIVDDDGTLYISSTSFQDYVTCPRRCYYRRILRVVPKEWTEPAAMAFGRAFHTAMEKFMTKGKAPKFDVLWEAETQLPDGVNKVLTFTTAEVDSPTLLARGKLMVKETIRVLKTLKVEKPYTMDAEGGKPTVEIQDRVLIAKGLILVRTIDLFAPVDGVPTIIDFKTSARAYTPGRQDSVSEQLTSYLVPHKILGVPQAEQAAFVVATKTKVPKAAWYPTTRSNKRLNMLIDDMKIVAEMIREGKFYRNRSDWNCGGEGNPNCDYWPLCYDSGHPNPKSLYKKLQPYRR